MAWDDLHEPRSSDDRPKGSGGPPSGGGGGKPPFDLPQIQIPKFKPSVFLGIGLVVLLAWILPSVVYFVEPDEEGVVTTFGEFSRTSPPGMYFKFPSPIEHARTPKVTLIRRAEVGIRSTRNGPAQRVPAESLMLTGDQNLVDINLVVQYTIKDSVAYLFNTRNPRKLVKDSAETVIRGIIGSNKIDEALTTGKAKIQIDAKVLIQNLMDKYETGIHVVTVQLQDVSPPQQVAAAFKDVVSAREDKERMINEAQGYRNTVIPAARGQAAEITLKAEAYREEVIKKSEGDVNRFMSQYEAYKKAPAVTRKRIYLETMEEILPEMNKFVMSSDNKGVLPILPLGKNPLLPDSRN
jgi:membrane protease subunit HflK